MTTVRAILVCDTDSWISLCLSKLANSVSTNMAMSDTENLDQLWCHQYVALNSDSSGKSLLKLLQMIQLLLYVKLGFCSQINNFPFLLILSGKNFPTIWRFSSEVTRLNAT